jgi:hypothetical protein
MIGLAPYKLFLYFNYNTLSGFIHFPFFLVAADTINANKFILQFAEMVIKITFYFLKTL